MRETAGIPDTSYDARIAAVIGRWLPALEHAVDAAFLDTGDPGLDAVLNLGATETIAGEVHAQRRREPGASDGLSFGGFEIVPAAVRDPADPTGLKAQGLARLRPFLKAEARLAGALGVGTGGER